MEVRRLECNMFSQGRFSELLLSESNQKMIQQSDASENASSRIPKQFLAAGDSLGDLKTDLQRELASREME